MYPPTASWGGAPYFAGGTGRAELDAITLSWAFVVAVRRGFPAAPDRV